MDTVHHATGGGVEMDEAKAGTEEVKEELVAISRAAALAAGHGKTADDAPLLCDVLRRHVQQHAEFVCSVWLDGDGRETESMTCLQLWERAGAVAEQLTSRSVGLRRGDKAVIVFEPSLDFLPALLGCLRAGIVAVSVTPPDLSRPGPEMKRLRTLVEDSGARVIVTTSKFKVALQAAHVAGHTLPRTIEAWVVCKRARRSAGLWLAADAKGLTKHEVAFIQYTSGSSGSPKGVLATHRALSANLRNIAATVSACGHAPPLSTAVTWLPQYHDYGLVCNYLRCLYHLQRLVAFSPISFLRDPEMWPRAAAKYGASITNAPSFSYELCAKRMRVSGNKYDLGKLLADAAAEPVTEACMEAMLAMGVKAEMRTSSYGCAECVVWTGTLYHDTKQPKLRQGYVGCANIPQSCGLESFIAIADPRTKTVLPDGQHGNIFLAGACVTPGYHDKPQVTAERFNLSLQGTPPDLPVDGWYDTQDIGFIEDGMLFIAGRASDTIIIAGRNIFPSDIERTAERFFPDALRPGCGVAVQATPSTAALFLEAREPLKLTVEQLQQLRRELEAQHRLQVTPIVVFRRRTLPKTTSGKVRRKVVRRMYFERTLPAPLIHIGHMAGGGGGGETEAATFEDLLREFGVQDMSASLAANGLDSLRLSRLIQHASDRFDIRIDVADTDSVPCSQLPTRSARPPPRRRVAASVVAACQWSNARGRVESGATSTSLAPRGSSASTPPSVAVPKTASSRPTTPGTSTMSVAASVATHVDGPTAGRAGGDRRRQCGVKAFALAQAFGVGVLVALVCACVGVASIAYVEMVEWLLVRPQYHSPWLHTFEGGPGLALVVGPLTWMAAWTLTVIVVKWLLVGRVKPGFVPLWSTTFWRFWFVDRCLAVWEATVGGYLTGTPYINVFYRLLGCRQLPLSVRLNSFLRYPDLFSCGPQSEVSGKVQCDTWGRDGMLLGEVRVKGFQTVRGEAVVFSGEVFEARDRSATITFDREALQRVVAPAVILPVFLFGLYTASWLSVQVGFSNNDQSGRTLFTFLATGTMLLLTSAVAGRLIATGWLVDKVYCVAARMMELYVRDSVLSVVLFKLMGAHIDITAHANHPFVMMPSSAHRVKVGPHALLSGAVLRPNDGKHVIVGERASIGFYATLRDCVVGAGAGIGTAVPVPEGLRLDDDMAVVGRKTNGELIIVPAGRHKDSHPSRCSVWATLLGLLMLRTALVGVPVALGYTAVLNSAREVAAAMSDAHVSVQAATVALVVMTLSSILLLLVETVYGRLFVPWGQDEVQLPIMSARAAAWGAYHSFQHLGNTWLHPFYNGSILQSIRLRLRGVQFEDIWATPSHGFVVDNHRCFIGRGAVLKATMVAHVGERGHITFTTASAGAFSVGYNPCLLLGSDHLPERSVILPMSKLTGAQLKPRPAGAPPLVLSGTPALPSVAMDANDRIAFYHHAPTGHRGADATVTTPPHPAAAGKAATSGGSSATSVGSSSTGNGDVETAAAGAVTVDIAPTQTV